MATCWTVQHGPQESPRMSVYRHYIFPKLLDLAMTSRAYRRPRVRTLASASGRIDETAMAKSIARLRARIRERDASVGDGL